MKHVKLTFFVYFTLLVVAAIFIVPYRDSFYLWDWGNHLALSYLDGPPMIAYMMKLSSSLFGTTFFSINILSTLCAGVICYFIYKIGTLIANKKTGVVASLLWLTFPFVTQNFILKTTYDVPENVFWTLTIYGVLLYMKVRSNSAIYLTGLAIGLLLLSKFTGIVLVLAIFIYLIGSKEERPIFTRVHFYVALGLIIVIFSPVLIWNAQHQGGSFKYLFLVHTNSRDVVHASLTAHVSRLLQYVGRLLGCYHVLIVLPAMFLINDKLHHRHKASLGFLFCVVGVFILFWGLIAWFFSVGMNLSVTIPLNYLTPCVIPLSVLTAYYLVHHGYHTIIVGLLTVFMAVSLSLIIGSTTFFKSYFSSEYMHYLLLKEATTYQKPGEPMISSFFNNLANLNFWLKKQGIEQTMHVINEYVVCDAGSHSNNEYTAWSSLSLPIQSGLFIDVDMACVKPYFKVCQPVARLVAQQNNSWIAKQPHSQVMVYRCTH